MLKPQILSKTPIATKNSSSMSEETSKSRSNDAWMPCCRKFQSNHKAIQVESWSHYFTEVDLFRFIFKGVLSRWKQVSGFSYTFLKWSEFVPYFHSAILYLNIRPVKCISINSGLTTFTFFSLPLYSVQVIMRHECKYETLAIAIKFYCESRIQLRRRSQCRQIQANSSVIELLSRPLLRIPSPNRFAIMQICALGCLANSSPAFPTF